MSISTDLSNSYKTNYIVVIKDTAHNVLVKSFIANTTLTSLWNELIMFYGSSNIRSLKTGNLEDPVLLAPNDYKAIVLGEVLDTGVIKVFDTDISRGIDDLLNYFESSQWSKSREQRTE
uniref:Nonstructural protein n=1 Tax=Dulem virus 125 TaxID=3145602 RepID=A0AAU8AXQ5_9VIRU